MADKDAFDVWREWATEGCVTDFQVIPARIRDSVMMLTPKERKNRVIVNEAVRTQASPLRPAGCGVPRAED
jgi:hypothetical protein